MLVACTQTTISPTPAPKPINSPAPIITLTPIPSSTLIIINSPTPSSTITPSQIYGQLTSPDGTKKIQSFDWNNYEILTSDGVKLWSFSYENKFGSAEPAAIPFHWSNDGNYIYITCVHGPDDSSTKFLGRIFGNGDCVFRFDVHKGSVTEIVPEIKPGYYAFSISPDDSMLVYANQTETPVTVKLMSLITKTEKILFTANESIIEVGDFGWSPNKDKLVFTSMTMTEDEGQRFYTIFVFDLENLTAKPIVENFSESLRFETWNEQDEILYRDSYHEAVYQEKMLWVLNLQSRALSPLGTSTPQP